MVYVELYWYYADDWDYIYNRYYKFSSFKKAHEWLCNRLSVMGQSFEGYHESKSSLGTDKTYHWEYSDEHGEIVEGISITDYEPPLFPHGIEVRE